MRCKACDCDMTHPTKVVDVYSKKEYEEWLCLKCTRLSFIQHDTSEDEMVEQIISDGFLKPEE